MQRCIEEFHDNSRREHAAVKLDLNSDMTKIFISAHAHPAVLVSTYKLQVLHAAHGTGAICLLQCHR